MLRPTRWTPSSAAARASCCGVDADALVHDLEARVARAQRDLLGAVRVAVADPACRREASADGRAVWASSATLLRSASSAARSSTSGTRAPATPVGARYSPNTPRRASAHSPVVTPAFAAAIDVGMRFSSGVAPPSPAPASARSDGRPRRAAFETASRRSTCPISAAGSTRKMASAIRLVEWTRRRLPNALTPTTICSPRSMAAMRAALRRSRAAP